VTQTSPRHCIVEQIPRSIVLTSNLANLVRFLSYPNISNSAGDHRFRTILTNNTIFQEKGARENFPRSSQVHNKKFIVDHTAIMPPRLIRLACSQARTLSTLPETLSALSTIVHNAATSGVDLILFPEAYLGGYPRTCSFGSVIGSRSDEGREQFLQYFRSAVDLGDTPRGAGEGWVKRRLPVPAGAEYRGDGTREFLERVARETGVFIVTGLVERSGGSLYCSAVYVCPRLGCLGKRRKVMPTGSERLIWAQGSPSTLKAVTTVIKGVRITMAAAICWENLMPLLRYSLYSQNVNLWLAPTADARDTWVPLVQTIGQEGRCFVLSAISCVRRGNLPPWTSDAPKASATTTASESTNPATAARNTTKSADEPQTTQGRISTIMIKENEHELVLPTDESEVPTSLDDAAQSIVDRGNAPKPQSASASTDNVDGDDFVSRGGSCIIGPRGQILVEPLWEVEEGGLIIQDVDFDDCDRGRLDLDVAGSYSRSDAFKLTVEGLDIDPPV
jgi:nitrilase